MAKSLWSLIISDNIITSIQSNKMKVGQEYFYLTLIFLLQRNFEHKCYSIVGLRDQSTSPYVLQRFIRYVDEISCSPILIT